MIFSFRNRTTSEHCCYTGHFFLLFYWRTCFFPFLPVSHRSRNFLLVLCCAKPPNSSGVFACGLGIMRLWLDLFFLIISENMYSSGQLSNFHNLLRPMVDQTILKTSEGRVVQYGVMLLYRKGRVWWGGGERGVRYGEVKMEAWMALVNKDNVLEEEEEDNNLL